MRPAGVLFDFDGVVVDSLPLHLEAWEAAHNELFGNAIEAQTLRELLGRSTKAIAKLLANARGIPEKAAVLADLKREWLRQNVRPVPLIPGIRELFAELTRAKFSFGIASNAPRAFIRQTLAAHELDVTHFLGLEDYIRPKPNPEPYLKAARLVGIPLTEHRHTYVFEDSTHGLKAAVRAGMIPIGVTSQHAAALLREGGAQLTCENMFEVIEKGWLEKIPGL